MNKKTLEDKLLLQTYMQGFNDELNKTITTMSNKMKIEKIEDIYPLTIIAMRYGGKIIVLNTIAENHIVSDLQELEEPHYDLEKWMNENPVPEYYGIGNTIWEAFEDYKKRYYQ